jgi:hypothetical protein
MAVLWRELLIARTDSDPVGVGLVSLDNDEPSFTGDAAEVFAQYRAKHGDVGAAELLLRRGWSNGQGSSYLGPLQPATA